MVGLFIHHTLIVQFEDKVSRSLIYIIALFFEDKIQMHTEIGYFLQTHKVLLLSMVKTDKMTNPLFSLPLAGILDLGCCA